MSTDTLVMLMQTQPPAGSPEPCPGLHSAEALVRLGLRHDIVVPALRREIGLTSGEAECAWHRACLTTTAVDAHDASLRKGLR